jgi:hypothetical protein
MSERLRELDMSMFARTKRVKERPRFPTPAANGEIIFSSFTRFR